MALYNFVLMDINSKENQTTKKLLSFLKKEIKNNTFDLKTIETKNYSTQKDNTSNLLNKKNDSKIISEDIKESNNSETLEEEKDMENFDSLEYLEEGGERENYFLDENQNDLSILFKKKILDNIESNH